jgi:hypothetical protein
MSRPVDVGADQRSLHQVLGEEPDLPLVGTDDEVLGTGVRELV